MGRLPAIVGVVVMVALGISAVGAQSLLFPAQPADRPSGCHGNGLGHPVPSPSPAGYQCCLTGHSTAVPQATYPEPMLLQLRRVLSSEMVPSVQDCVPSDERAISSGDPPGASPLRI
ncbi:MAG TPA: hypothetical protein VNW47_08235 [Terriglobales bacterium]|nr:hypothetical protein [Terriglobales bacterium]